MKKNRLKCIERLISKRGKESTYLDNDTVMYAGESNIDDIDVDFEAFFKLYDKEKTENNPCDKCKSLINCGDCDFFDYRKMDSGVQYEIT